MSLQAKHIKAEFKTSEGSSVLKWEHHPISAAHAQENNSSSHAKSSSSSSTAAAPEAKSPAVLATVKTTVPPGCRTQNINGLCGAIYAVPRLALVETSPASSTSQKVSEQTTYHRGHYRHQQQQPICVLLCTAKSLLAKDLCTCFDILLIVIVAAAIFVVSRPRTSL